MQNPCKLNNCIVSKQKWRNYIEKWPLIFFLYNLKLVMVLYRNLCVFAHISHSFFQNVNISTCVSGRGQLIIGDYEGMIFLLNRQFQLSTFNAYQIRVSHLFMMKQSNLLISIGVSLELNTGGKKKVRKNGFFMVVLQGIEFSCIVEFGCFTSLVPLSCFIVQRNYIY